MRTIQYKPEKPLPLSNIAQYSEKFAAPGGHGVRADVEDDVRSGWRAGTVAYHGFGVGQSNKSDQFPPAHERHISHEVRRVIDCGDAAWKRNQSAVPRIERGQ